MPFTAEEKKKYNREYYKKQKKEKKEEEREKQSDRLDEITYEILHEEDSSGPRHKSECLSNAQLIALYENFVADAGNLPDTPYTKWLELRDTARKDLFWLGDVLGWRWYPHVHLATCNFFVKKNFDGVYHEDYTLKDVHDAIERQDDCHHRLLLDPRYHYKTTIDSVDCLQWLINVPDIRIFIVTAEEENADDFLRQIKSYLYQPDGAELTKFQAMFPEFVLRGTAGYSSQPFVSPARRHNQKDPTMWADSISATLSTQHCDIMKADDVISNRNSNTERTRKELKRKFDGAIHVIDPWGFFDVIGTRYSSDDWYGTRVLAEQEARDSGLYNTLKVQIRSAWTVKEGWTEEGVSWRELPIKKLKLEMVDLLFPELKSTPQKTFERFMVDAINNELDFRCQLLNEPAHDADAPWINPFTDALLTASTTHASNGPNKDEGDLVIWWDTALTDGKQSDYSAGVVGQIWKRPDEMWELFIWQVFAEKMTTFDLAKSIVALSKKWNPIITQFEQPRSLEIKDFISAVNKQKNLQEYFGPIVGVYPDQQKDAKINRIKGLEVLFRLGLIKFAFGPWIDLAFEQFKDFTGTSVNKGRKDDIPDAIGKLARRLPMIGLSPNPEGEVLLAEQRKAEIQQQRRQMYDSYFGTGAGTVSTLLHPENDEPTMISPIHKALEPLKSYLPAKSPISFPRRADRKEGM